MEFREIEIGEYDVDAGVHKITDYSMVNADMMHRDFKDRLYLHIDMNCYYAQVEQMCYNMYGMPIYVGGWYKEDTGIARGIVATSSYEARAFGIKTGMSAFEAEQLCPYIIGMQAHYSKYKGISRVIHACLLNFTPTVEKYSMDEYFLDVTHIRRKSRAEIHQFAKDLQDQLFEWTRLHASIGISYSKTYSKLASDLQKPNGIVLVLNPEEAAQVLYPLPLDEVWGIGSRRYRKLKERGIVTIQDAIDRGYHSFKKLFGEYFGKLMWEMVVGRDRAMVLEDPKTKTDQLNYMHTFSSWTVDVEEVMGELAKAINTLCYRMRGYGVRACKYFCYVRLQDAGHRGVGFRFNTDGFTNLDDYIFYECWQQARPLIVGLIANGERIRGLGIGTHELNLKNQLELFWQENQRVRNYYLAQDAVKNKYGVGAIKKAAMMSGVSGKTHFLERNG